MYSDHDVPNSFRDNCLSFDTYPDGLRHQKLVVRGRSEEKVEEVANIFLPLKFDGVSQVGLHPRVRGDGNL